MKWVLLCLRSLAVVPRKCVGALARLRFYILFPTAGKGSAAPLSVEFKCPENIKIGAHVAIGPMTTLGGFGGIVLEDYVRISKGVTLETAGLNLSSPLPYKHVGKQILVKRGAWLGTRCIILSGVTIGENAVVGAGAIVTKDVGDHEIVVAQPLRSLTKPVGQPNDR